MLKLYTPEELKQILADHALWLQNSKMGKRANLSYSNLSGSDLSNSDLSGSDLSGSDLRYSNLRGSDLRGSNLSGSDLRCFGNMCQIRTIQIDTWHIGYTHDTLQIGCQRHTIGKWRKWDSAAGRKWIDRMDSEALAWAKRNLALVLAIIDANPAEK